MNSGTQAIDGMARSACNARIEQAAHQRRIAGGGADHRGGGHADAEAGGDAPQRHQRVALQFAGAREIDEGREDHRRRRHQPAGGPAHPHDEFPGQPPAPTGSTKPSAGRAKRDQRRFGARPLRRGGFGGDGHRTRDMAAANAMCQFRLSRAQWSWSPSEHGCCGLPRNQSPVDGRLTPAAVSGA